MTGRDPRVRQDYAGIEISPYQYECRFELTWYYGWDVASGCVWDKEAIRAVEPVDARILTGDNADA